MLAAACAGQPQAPQPVVLLEASGTGDASKALSSTSKHGWDLHWSYDCSNAGGHGVFVAEVFDSDNAPYFRAPGVDEEGSKDAGVYHVPAGGRFYLEITSTCKWTVKVVEAT